MCTSVSVNVLIFRLGSIHLQALPPKLLTIFTQEDISTVVKLWNVSFWYSQISLLSPLSFPCPTHGHVPYQSPNVVCITTMNLSSEGVFRGSTHSVYQHELFPCIRQKLGLSSFWPLGKWPPAEESHALHACVTVWQLPCSLVWSVAMLERQFIDHELCSLWVVQ